MMAASKAQELNCNVNDIACLCKNPNFGYGLRDCSAAICPGQDAAKVVEYGIAICKCKFTLLEWTNCPILT